MKFTALAMIPALFHSRRPSHPDRDSLGGPLESVSLAIPAMLFSLMWASWIVTGAVVALYWAARIARYAFRKNITPHKRPRVR